MEINETNEPVLVHQINALGKAPVAIEAFWDGDTTGWFVVLGVVVQETSGHLPTYVLHELTIFRYGGDIRLFHGQVPPWPEAEAAQQVGQEVARLLDIPFYFPFSDEPEDECPHWWEQAQALACQGCGKPILPGSPWTTKGLCYSCNRKRERESQTSADS